MSRSNICKCAGIVAVLITIALVAVSCNRKECRTVTPPEHEECTQECVYSEAETNTMQARGIRYELEFHRLVVSSNMSERATWSQASALCEEISKLPEAEAIPLLDNLLEMAIDQHVTETNLYHRQVWFRQLFYVAGAAFCFAQGKRKDSFGDWDRMFRFFGKCTNEIVAVEQSLPSSNRRYWDASDLWKASYLSKIKGDFETWIHIIRDFHFPSLSEGLAEEQKADILRRFDDLKKYTVTTPKSDGSPAQIP